MSNTTDQASIGRKILRILNAPIGRSVLCIFVGFVVVVVITLITDVILHKIHFYPPLGEYNSGSVLIWATVYRTIYGVIGSYVTARLAPIRPMMHALIGGAIGMVIATAGAAVTWNHVPPLGPHWYPSRSSSALCPRPGSAPRFASCRRVPASDGQVLSQRTVERLRKPFRDCRAQKSGDN